MRIVNQARVVAMTKGIWQPDGFGYWQGHRGITYFSDAEDDGRGGGQNEGPTRRALDTTDYFQLKK